MKKIISLTIVLVIIMGLFSTAYGVERDNDTWVPCEGYAWITQSTQYVDTFYVSNTWSWDSDDRLSGFHVPGDTNETFELDIVCCDTYGFAEGWYNYGSSRGTYWETNQPRPYWDSIAFEPSNETSFTVGCSDATLFQKDTTYYWWAYCEENSNFTDDEVKINAQRASRTFSWIYEQSWAILQAEQTIKVVPYGDWNVPSGKTWTFD